MASTPAGTSDAAGRTSCTPSNGRRVAADDAARHPAQLVFDDLDRTRRVKHVVHDRGRVIDPQIPAMPSLALHRHEHRPARLIGMPVRLAAQLRHGVGASSGIVRHGPDGRGRIFDSGWWSCAGRPLGPGTRTLDRNSGYLGRSDCTAPPACGSARTGTVGPVGPCALRRHRRCWTDASQRAKLRWHRLHRHGVGRGTVYKLASKWDRAASTFFGVNAVVSPARQRRPRCPSAPPSRPPCRAAWMANTLPTIRAQSSADPGAVRSTYETATSPSNVRGS